MLINATLCYIKSNDQTLMLCRNKKSGDIHHGKWNGLGGKFEAGETPEECAIREIKEESGLSVVDMELKGILTFPLFDLHNDWIVFVYIVTRFSGNLVDSPEGSLKWIPDRELMELNLWEGDRIFIPWLLEKRFFSAKFVYEAGRLARHSASFYI